MNEGVINAEQAAFNNQLLAVLPKLKASALYLTKDAVARTQDTSIPDDLLQRTCLRALSRTHQFHGDNIFAWTYQIMRSIWFTELRDQKFRQTTELDETVHCDDDFEKTVLDKLMVSDIRRACSHLPDEEFDLVVRFHCLDQTYQEIAQDINISIWTLRSRITKTKEKIIKHMKDIK